MSQRKSTRRLYRVRSGLEAVARKLAVAVLLHRLWVSGEVYEPLRQSLLARTEQEAA